jgi:hypothetical protein
MDFELKFKNSSRNKFDLNSKEVWNFDLIQRFKTMITVQLLQLTFGMLQAAPPSL